MCVQAGSVSPTTRDRYADGLSQTAPAGPRSLLDIRMMRRTQVCGLAWSPDDRSLASGGNDNQLLVWNAHSANPVLRFTEHQVCRCMHV